MTYRSHTCGELRKEHAGSHVKLAGWVDSIKVMSKFGFCNLRDRYGTTQVFFDGQFLDAIKDVRRESVIQVEGEVKVKPKANPKLATGEIEIGATSVKVLSAADPLPMELDESIESTEETRLTSRYLDLRKPRMQKNIALRHQVTMAMRSFFDQEGFLEIETPMLAKSTPEGARDYLVPSRVQQGKFYALPQSPQIFKQLCMVSGFDKYFQIVRCFRDEDLRADRQPEFTQLDMEMSFVEEEDIFSAIERCLQQVFKKALNVDLTIPFSRISHAEAMAQHKSDKPDLRKNKEEWAFLWVTQFPMFEKDEESGRWSTSHHPFTKPSSDDFSDLSKVKSTAYDLVLNGVELGSGSLRIFDPVLQQKVFDALGLSKEEAQEKFGFLMNAMKYGNPPLGGIALGLDRLVALMAGEESIREVIAFPKTKDAEDLMMGSPSAVSKEQLEILGLKKG